ncbi:MAG: glycosyltransferase family 2 protein [Candidatus Eisenbacteria bacterium]|uniref:Glycosyltransferase family 2 protein n=1 Tax=Eiseniibacteriota bacterium TaxID=2212470 RepID=A0A948RX67_UNCEI|nr:glycosyltransferase family 2 protein [Candidatus Eisenbacteria bacterium]MBU1951157.1 glycosyltransferase family 2 protein [Candidatus Eisenbacteria bacterium]MBU2692505.1 glycosyltransferase family 2 protein [Candidatus Eisenbacteria bacterium]
MDRFTGTAPVEGSPAYKATLVIPAYNEEQGIVPVLEELKRLGDAYEILVVDDGSTDGTSETVRRSGVKVIRHPKNRGYGAALKTGIREAKSPIIVITDADGTYPNERIPELVARMSDVDMVVGGRTGTSVAIPLIRRPAKWFLNRLANYLSEADIPDLNSGLRAFRRDVAIHFFPIFPSGFSFTTTITLAMLVNGYIVEYIPIDYHHRKGKSKIRPIYDTLNFISLIVRTVLYFRPLKIFLPIAGLLLLASLLIFIGSWLFLPKIMDATVSITFMSGLQMAALGLLADLIDKRSGWSG